MFSDGEIMLLSQRQDLERSVRAYKAALEERDEIIREKDAALKKWVQYEKEMDDLLERIESRLSKIGYNKKEIEAIMK